jgi:3-phenylpropionate/cinnamic acid dioxygenase small subunit
LYWIPLTREQPDGINYTSLLYEDKLLLKIRIERLKNPRSFSQQPPSFCQHILQQPVIESAGPGAEEWVVRTPFLYIEAQLDAQVVLAGVSYLHLVRTAERLLIRLKKVELVNREAALPSIQLFP